MEMDATGTSSGDWIFHGEFDQTAAYLSDQKKILGFNPFCHSIEQTSTENVFRWHFRVTDPQNNPFDVIFYVEQSDEMLLDLPKHLAVTDHRELSQEIIQLYTVGKKISWKHHQLPLQVDDPANYLFEGKAYGDLLMHRMPENQTKVHFKLRIDVRFTLYPAFRIIPEQIISTMTNACMCMIMQSATNKTFHSISKDFVKIEHA